jgi:hypothetical protein
MVGGCEEVGEGKGGRKYEIRNNKSEGNSKGRILKFKTTSGGV